MTQYQDATPEPRVDNDKRSVQSLEKRVRELAEQNQRHSEQIETLDRQLQRLKNELRVAVNAFNLKTRDR